MWMTKEETVNWWKGLGGVKAFDMRSEEKVWANQQTTVVEIAAELIASSAGEVSEYTLQTSLLCMWV